MSDCSTLELWFGDECDLLASSDDKRDLVVSIIDRLNEEAQKLGQSGVRLFRILRKNKTYSSKVFYTIGGEPCDHVAPIKDYIELYHDQVTGSQNVPLAGAA